jgi:hypothetical protein
VNPPGPVHAYRAHAIADRGPRPGARAARSSCAGACRRPVAGSPRRAVARCGARDHRLPAGPLSALPLDREGRSCGAATTQGATFHPVLVGAPFDPHESYPPPAEPPAAVAARRPAAGGLPRTARCGARRTAARRGGAAPALELVSALAFGPAAPVPAAFAVVATPSIPIEGDRRLAAAPGDGLYRARRRPLAAPCSRAMWCRWCRTRPTRRASTPTRPALSSGPSTVGRRSGESPLVGRSSAWSSMRRGPIGCWPWMTRMRCCATTDAGATWTRSALPVEPQALAQPVPGAPARVLVAASDNEPDEPALLASDDLGATWHGLPPREPTSFERAGGQPRRPDPHLRPHTDQPPAGGHRQRAPTAGASWSAHGAPLDGHGADVTLAATTVLLRRVAGGAERPRVRIPAPTGARRGRVRRGRRTAARTAGRSRRRPSLRLLRVGRRPRVRGERADSGRASRRGCARPGGSTALVRISATDDNRGVEHTRWER